MKYILVPELLTHHFPFNQYFLPNEQNCAVQEICYFSEPTHMVYYKIPSLWVGVGVLNIILLLYVSKGEQRINYLISPKRNLFEYSFKEYRAEHTVGALSQSGFVTWPCIECYNCFILAVDSIYYKYCFFIACNLGNVPGTGPRLSPRTLTKKC